MSNEKKAVQSVETIASIEEKGHTQLAKASVSKTTDTSAVAIQYPEAVTYDLTESSIESLGKKYSHLKQLDVDSKEDYKELTAAISDVKTHRTNNEKQEKAIKDPLNAFRSKVIDLGKKLRKSISIIEDDLKAEKQRIDDIKAERLAEQQRLWTKNLTLTVSLAQIQPGMSLEALQGHLQAIEAFDLDGYDFGDHIEQAKTNKANAHAQVTQVIAMEKQRLEQVRIEAERKQKEAEAEALRKKEAEEQAKKDRIVEEEAAAQQKKIDELQAQLAEANKPAEPEPELETQSAKPEIKPESEKRIGGYPVEAPKNVIDTSGMASGFDQAEEEQIDETGANDIPVLTQPDICALNLLADDLEKICNIHKLIEYETELALNSATKVFSNTEKAAAWLRSQVIGGEL